MVICLHMPGAPAQNPTWIKARALYEKGIGFTAIHAETNLNISTLRLRAKNEKWERGVLLPRLQEREQQAAEREAERHGVTKARVLEKVTELMEAKKTEFFRGTIVCDVTDNSTRLGATNLAADILGMKKQTESPDLAQSILAWVRSQT